MSIKHTLTAAAFATAGLMAATGASADVVFPDSMVVGYGEPTQVSNYAIGGSFPGLDDKLTVAVNGTPTRVNLSFDSCGIIDGGSLLFLGNPLCGTSGTSTSTTSTIYASLKDAADVEVWGSFLNIAAGPQFSASLAGLSGIYTLVLNPSAGITGGNVDIAIAAVPIPAAAILFGTALAGFAGFSARRKAA
ncbi:hypothetical protein GH975_05900 [Litorivicinus lipolyticus]|jgi:hypothetical protein|uniref:VPLPA-CTERM protein sorting domain protein n=1 Tax=Litorivicinus lipolyticus TaxID=418701 RepID=A0A5Q2QCS2_9GAMM|nr:hypothetical protein [Litorivicinus lipolyticus]QGG80131.1 hypothetical protein GH975_05900 [Litorivicinus lipolyticus]